MCGLHGIINVENNLELSKDCVTYIKRGLWLQNHRGPDGAGHWHDDDNGVYLAHNRLAIVDLNDRSNQPIFSSCNRYIAVFNGEIYNYRSLKSVMEREGHRFVTKGDTEVVVELFSQHGVKAFAMLSGMFAIAIYDTNLKQLILARDMAGEKPLYYTKNDKFFRFSSELRTLISTKEGVSLNYSQLNRVLTEGYCNNFDTVLEGVKKLPAAHYIMFDIETAILSDPVRYEARKRISKKHVTKKIKKTQINDFDKLLEKVICQHASCDAPPIFLLSGGLDSSLIAAKAAQSLGEINTIAVTYGPGFSGFDEAQYSDRVAEHIGAKHTVVTLNADVDVVSIIDKVVDDPFIDSSILPTFEVYSAVKQLGYKVAIGGDGADEVFGGYKKYNRLLAMHSVLNLLPVSSTIFLAKGLQCLFPKFYPNWRNNMNRIRVSDAQINLASLVNKDFQPKYGNKKIDSYDFVAACMEYDFDSYLAEDLLVKVDRCSMANSVEARSPFLDKRIIHYCDQTIDIRTNVGLSKRKGLLVDIARSLLPPDYNFRRKSGFRFPIGDWLESEAGIELFTQGMVDIKNFDVSIHKKLCAQKEMSDELKFGIICLSRWLQKLI